MSCFQGVFNKRSGSATGFSQPRITLAEKTRNRARAEALARPLVRVPDVRPIAQPKSLETIAGECGVRVAALEKHIQDELKSFCVETATSNLYLYRENWALMDTLYNLFLQSIDNQSPQWIRNTRDFDSFITHFCPKSNKNSQSILINHIGSFFRDHLPPMAKLTSDRVNNTIYNGSRNWMKFPEALVDMEVVEEARQLVNEGFTGKEKLFVHGTGSAAMANFAKNQAIWSASRAMQSGDKVVTGEYVKWIEQDGQTSTTGGTSGLRDIYTSRNGLSSESYTMRRWFDETPVTFGISEQKQRAYNDACNIDRWYENPMNEGVTVGPIVPLKNVVAISAPKASEARIRSWIAAHCPHAKFVSYEAAIDYWNPIICSACYPLDDGQRPPGLDHQAQVFIQQRQIDGIAERDPLDFDAPWSTALSLRFQRYRVRSARSSSHPGVAGAIQTDVKSSTPVRPDPSIPQDWVASRSKGLWSVGTCWN
ncbi:MAG: hypothetical protein JF606_17505 [Burkholderiales bacterium]|nr:hypothetical protein [Burkholderiales bacterium]